MKDTKEGFVKGTKKLFRFLSWLIPIAVVIVAVIFVFFRRTPDAAGPTDDPRHLLFNYVKAVSYFAPGSTQLPVQQDYDSLLAFFSEADRKFVKDNFDALAWLGMSQDDRLYRQADDLKKTQAVYKLIVGQGPSGALTFQGVRPPDEQGKQAAPGAKPPAKSDQEIKDKAIITVSSTARRFDVPAVLEGGRWRIEGLWGIPQRFVTEIGKFNASHGSK